MKANRSNSSSTTKSRSRARPRKSRVQTRRYLGAGIGLSLTRRLVEAHGAEISIMSRPNKGTTVTVVFPAERTVQPGNRLAS